MSHLTAGAVQYRWLIEPRYEHAQCFNEGLAAVRIDDRYGFIDMSGGFVIKPQYDLAGDFRDGAAPVVIDGTQGLINKKGISVILHKTGDDIYFGEGLAVIRVEDKYGYITQDGKIAIKPAFGSALNFSEGAAPVMKDGKYGFINKKGVFVLKPVFEKASMFSEGLAAVKREGVWGYINRSGRMVIKPRFLEAKEFSGGYAAVKTEAGFGYINRHGITVITPEFEACGCLTGGIAAVMVNGKWGYISIKSGGKTPGSVKTVKVKQAAEVLKTADSGKAGNGSRISGERENVAGKDQNKIPDRSRTISAEKTKVKFGVINPDSGDSTKIRGTDKNIETIEKKKDDYKPEFTVQNESKSDDYSVSGKGTTADAPVIKGMVYAGILSEVTQGQVVITDSASGVKYYMGAWCIIGVEDDRVYIEAGTPFSAVAKCDLRNGFYEKIKPGMKVYKKIK